MCQIIQCTSAILATIGQFDSNVELRREASPFFANRVDSLNSILGKSKQNFRSLNWPASRRKQNDAAGVNKCCPVVILLPTQPFYRAKWRSTSTGYGARKIIIIWLHFDIGYRVSEYDTL